MRNSLIMNVPAGFVCVIVPVACARAIVRFTGLVRFKRTVSSGAGVPASPLAQMVTVMVLIVSPGLKINVPFALV